jgi:hypothetical protein
MVDRGEEPTLPTPKYNGSMSSDQEEQTAPQLQVVGLSDFSLRVGPWRVKSLLVEYNTP